MNSGKVGRHKGRTTGDGETQTPAHPPTLYSSNGKDELALILKFVTASAVSGKDTAKIMRHALFSAIPALVK